MKKGLRIFVMVCHYLLIVISFLPFFGMNQHWIRGSVGLVLDKTGIHAFSLFSGIQDYCKFGWVLLLTLLIGTILSFITSFGKRRKAVDIALLVTIVVHCISFIITTLSILNWSEYYPDRIKPLSALKNVSSFLVYIYVAILLHIVILFLVGFIMEVKHKQTDAFDDVIPDNSVNQTVLSNSTEEIKKYKDLLDSGIITQEEFDTKKKQLLGL